MAAPDMGTNWLASCPSQPWKNGRGTTRLLASGMAYRILNQSEAEPDWRISMAEVTEDGPFSIFKGYDRCATVLEGEGATLTYHDGSGTRLRLRPRTPTWFDGETLLSAQLLAGPVHILNIMLRREICTAIVHMHHSSLNLKPALFRLILAPHALSDCVVSCGKETAHLTSGSFFTSFQSFDPLSVQVRQGPIATIAIESRPSRPNLG